jgi:thiosulfate/3-mercaptopyruvate sulfurtransferase
MADSIANPLIDVDGLVALLDDPAARPVLLDLRWKLGGPTQQPTYARGHIPGAVFVELEESFTGKHPPAPAAGEGGSGGRHPMPAADQVERAMRVAGVDDDSFVVCYDSGAMLAAARAWWVLSYLGANNVRVLDGGFRAWARTGRPMATGDGRAVRAGSFTARPGARRLLTAADVPAYAGEGRLLDARSAGRYAGEGETIDPVAGHIPGAVSTPATSLLDASGRMKSPEDLLALFAERDIGAGTDVALYCGSGVSACTIALSLAAAGLTDDPGVYVGSWSDWITDPDRSVTTGPLP